MTLFLFAKQIVDMLYQFRVLDYGMLILAVLLLIYQIGLVRPDFRKWFTVMDGLVIALGGLVTISFLRTWSGYQDYFKVMSAFLIYFVGRMYYDRIRESTGALVFSAYLVVYLNLFVRLLDFKMNFLTVTNANGDLYYYDTDMAFAMILAMVFIAMFGKSSLKKLFTILVVCPYMVFFSDAGIQKVMMIAVYAIVLIYIVELVLRKQKLTNALLTITVLGLLGIVVIIYLPVMGGGQVDWFLKLLGGKLLDAENMYGRYVGWSCILSAFEGQSALTRWFGLGMDATVKIESLYIEIFYMMGYVGLILGTVWVISFVRYVTKVEDRKSFYLAVIMAVILLGTGVAVNSMESTQMSWFPWLFVGMVVSSVEVTKFNEEQNEE